MYLQYGENEICVEHTWQAMHGGTHSCKIYKPLPKQELINRLSGKHPRTPLTQISSVATHRSGAIILGPSSLKVGLTTCRRQDAMIYYF